MPGSPGAGNVVYRLRLVETARTTCSLTGIPVARLLGTHGRRLPTHVVNAYPGRSTAVFVVLRRGRATTADARFSPDVPGPGEQHPGPCEPRAYTLRVTAPGGGAVTVPVRPPTSVCEHGRLMFSAFGARR